MNREEASFILANIDRRVCDDELNEALDMAIKALDQEPCGDAVDRAEAIKIADGYCHHTNVAKELAKLPSVNPQPYEDAISRQAVFDALDNHKYSNEFCEKHHIDWSINLSMAHIAVNDLPPVTPRQKYGKWIKQTLSVKPFGEDTVLCDQCAFMTDKDSMYNYCPNCGARMIEPQESEG